MAQLPSSRPARAAVIGSLVLGAVVATSLSVLIAIFLFTAACVSKPNAGSQIFGIDPPPLRAPPPAPGARVVSVDQAGLALHFYYLSPEVTETLDRFFAGSPKLNLKT